MAVPRLRGRWRQGGREPDESLFSSLKYSNNNSVVTIVLKPWKWSDGVPITSRDFTFVYNLLKVNYTNWLGYIQGLFPVDVTKVITPDSHTVVLDLNRSYNPTFYTDDVLSQIALIPQHAWDKTSVTGKVGNYDETTAGSKAVYSFLQKQGTHDDHVRQQPAVEGRRRAVDAADLQQQRLLRLGAEQELLGPGQAEARQGDLDAVHHRHRRDEHAALRHHPRPGRTCRSTTWPDPARSRPRATRSTSCPPQASRRSCRTCTTR